jgi:excisionase family DNA binding protein
MIVRPANTSIPVTAAAGAAHPSRSVRAGGVEQGVSASAARATPETVELRLVIQGEQVSALAALVADVLHGQVHASAGEAWPEWMNVDTAAGYLDCAKERIRKLVARRDIPFHQEAPGCRIFFRRQELDAWMAASRCGPMT